jgi:hypothetical protein
MSRDSQEHILCRLENAAEAEKTDSSLSTPLLSGFSQVPSCGLIVTKIQLIHDCELMWKVANLKSELPVKAQVIALYRSTSGVMPGETVAVCDWATFSSWVLSGRDLKLNTHQRESRR